MSCKRWVNGSKEVNGQLADLLRSSSSRSPTEGRWVSWFVDMRWVLRAENDIELRSCIRVSEHLKTALCNYDENANWAIVYPN